MADVAEAPVIAADKPLNPFVFEDGVNPRKDIEEALSGICLRSPGVCEGVAAAGVAKNEIWVATGRTTASKCAANILEQAGCRNMIGRPIAGSSEPCK